MSIKEQLDSLSMRLRIIEEHAVSHHPFDAKLTVWLGRCQSSVDELYRTLIKIEPSRPEDAAVAAEVINHEKRI